MMRFLYQNLPLVVTTSALVVLVVVGWAMWGRRTVRGGCLGAGLGLVVAMLPGVGLIAGAPDSIWSRCVFYWPLLPYKLIEPFWHAKDPGEVFWMMFLFWIVVGAAAGWWVGWCRSRRLKE